MEGLTRLDAETKVALMAALVYDDGDGLPIDRAVNIAIALEQLTHEKVGETFRDRKKSRL